MYQTLFFKRLTPIIVAVILISWLVTVQIPLEIYINNNNEFSFPLTSLFFVLLIAFSIVSIINIAPFFILNKKLQDYYFSLLATIALLIWFTAYFMYGKYGAFDGRGLSIAAYSLKSILEVSLWVVLLVLSLIFSKKIKKLQYQAVTALLTISFFLTGFNAVYYYVKNDNNSAQITNATKDFFQSEFLAFSNKGNIIHIVLDELQSTLTDTLLEKPNFSQHFDGFTYFPNTAANYPDTLLSVPTLISGKIYHKQQNIDEFIADTLNHNSFIQNLELSGYRTDFYVPARFCGYDSLENCTPLTTGSAKANAFKLLDYSLFKSVPDIIKPYIYRNEVWLISNHFISDAYEVTLPGPSHLAFTYFNDNFYVNNDKPTYKYFHSFITHSPLIFDENCNANIKRGTFLGVEGGIDQATCAFKHVFTFFEKLKKLNIYNNTMIIISSDHGGYYPIPNENLDASFKAIPPRHHGRALATLMIKPINSQGALKNSIVPAQLSDIPNTILDSFQLPLTQNGKNVFTLSPNEKRTRQYLYSEWNGDWLGKRLPPVTLYSIQGDVRNNSAWSYECSDDESLNLPIKCGY